MTPEEFFIRLKQTAVQVRQYADKRFPSMAGDTILRFINGNFRAQGFQGATFKRWKPSKGKNGTTLVNTGQLRAATYYSSMPGQVVIRNNKPYARVHNEGFKGTISIPAHTRNRYSQQKVGTGVFNKTGKERSRTQTVKSGQTMVKAHTRKVDIPQRQFMPITADDSPVLFSSIRRNISKDINKFFN